MHLLPDFFDRSKQGNQTPALSALPHHAQQGRYQIIHHALNIPNLPAPLHYLNFFSLYGQPKIQLCHVNESNALDIAHVVSSVSGKMNSHQHDYSVSKQCHFAPQQFEFGGRERLVGFFPNFQLSRQDDELSYELEIETSNAVSYLSKLPFGLAEHWSILCQCRGEILFQQEKITIHQIGSFEYSRSINFPYLPIAFLSYQIINLSAQRQILVMQTRDQFNHILQSKLYLRDLNQQSSLLFDQEVHFKIHRVYPKVKNPDGQEMYLPREFEWLIYKEGELLINIQAQSRGDFKFGLMAGYMGSFHYQVRIADQIEIGEGGYCEYIDCRSLLWQEQDKHHKFLLSWFYPELARLRK